MMSGDDSLVETTSLVDLGVDSLVAVEIRTWFSEEVGLDVGVLKILSGSSIEDLVDDAVHNLAGSLQDRRASGAGSSSDSTAQSDEGEMPSPVTTYDDEERESPRPVKTGS